MAGHAVTCIVDRSVTWARASRRLTVRYFREGSADYDASFEVDVEFSPGVMHSVPCLSAECGTAHSDIAHPIPRDSPGLPQTAFWPQGFEK